MNRKTTSLVLSALIVSSAAHPGVAQTTTPNSTPSATAPASTVKGDAVILTMNGQVEVSKQGASDWTPASAGMALKTGDKVRTAKNSRATVKLTNLSILRVYEQTTLEIQPPAQSAANQNPTLDLKAGAVYFFNRDKPETTQFRTPSASGAIRGTEFNLAVAEDGRMLLTLVDGEVDVKNELGSLELKTGEQAMVEPGKAPVKTASVDAVNVIQWTLYYPGVIDIDELGLADDLKVQLAPALEAYRSGDLLKAVDSYPFDRESASPEDKVLRAALWLSVGKVDQAENLLQNLGDGRAPQIAEALKELVAAVKNQSYTHTGTRTLATEWLAASYYLQSKGDLEGALNAAKSAAAKSPQFGFAHERVAELEFSFGHTDAALSALNKSLIASPRNPQALALKGFLLAAKNKITAARAEFDKAIAIDGNLGNAWLGRGLTKIKKGDVEAGRKDIETAVAVEPTRAVFRSYLGKAWSMGRTGFYSWDQILATKELNLAKELDPNDPTSWLYSALLNQQRNEVNDAVADLERSQDLNDNRRIFRSQMLLDQDKAVRGANLASIYRDAGMKDYSVREASKAVETDPANFSAHLFLAESYDALRDARTVNLRYETPWLNELLLANLLSPVGAGSLSQNISQQEYSRLFEADKFGVSAAFEYQSSGEVSIQGSQFGTLGNSAYAIDGDYRRYVGQRPNNDFESRYFSVKFKQQVTEKDSFFLQATTQSSFGGDTLQYYAQTSASPTLRTKEIQQPNLFAGYHRQWQPGQDTIVLVGRLDDKFTLTDPNATIFTVNRFPNGQVFNVPARAFVQYNSSEFSAYTAEIQHIGKFGDHTILGGARFQTGENASSTVLYRNPIKGFPPIYNNGGLPGTPVYPAAMQKFDTDLGRYSIYAYDYWQVADPFQVYAGLSYDHVSFPVNTDLSPLSGREDSRDQISPKLGMRYTPWKNTTFRAAATRSLGGLFFDNSVRLEPSQIAGFTQAYRSMIPESVVGNVAGTRFTTYGAGVEQKIEKTRTYLTLEAELLESQAERTVGVFNYTAFTPNARPGGTAEQLRYQERALALTVNQLLSDEWALGAKYRIADADLEDSFPQLNTPLFGTLPNRDIGGTLQQLTAFVVYNHRCGFFLRNEATWAQQTTTGFAPALENEDFWQFNSFVGYRFPRRQAEVSVGVLNITGREYQLHPLTLYSEYPRERTFVMSCKINF